MHASRSPMLSTSLRNTERDLTPMRSSPLRRGVCAVGLLAVCFLACSGEGTTGPGDDLPPSGSSGSAGTNAEGIAAVPLGGAVLQVEVKDQLGEPIPGIMVGVSVGDDVIALVTADPAKVLPPTASCHTSLTSQFSSCRLALRRSNSKHHRPTDDHTDPWGRAITL